MSKIKGDWLNGTMSRIDMIRLILRVEKQKRGSAREFELLCKDAKDLQVLCYLRIQKGDLS